MDKNSCELDRAVTQLKEGLQVTIQTLMESHKKDKDEILEAINSSSSAINLKYDGLNSRLVKLDLKVSQMRNTFQSRICEAREDIRKQLDKFKAQLKDGKRDLKNQLRADMKVQLQTLGEDMKTELKKNRQAIQQEDKGLRKWAQGQLKVLQDKLSSLNKELKAQIQKSTKEAREDAKSLKEIHQTLAGQIQQMKNEMESIRYFMGSTNKRLSELENDHKNFQDFQKKAASEIKQQHQDIKQIWKYLNWGDFKACAQDLRSYMASHRKIMVQDTQYQVKKFAEMKGELYQMLRSRTKSLYDIIRSSQEGFERNYSKKIDYINKRIEQLDKKPS